jgi:hypothetical protein
MPGFLDASGHFAHWAKEKLHELIQLKLEQPPRCDGTAAVLLLR